MAKQLEGKVVLMTGTGRGMAREVALRFAQEGAGVVGCDIDADAAQETAELVRAAGGEMESLHPIDLTDEAQAHRLAAFAVEKFGGIDVLYNSAMSMQLATPEHGTAAAWRHTLENTLTLHYLVTKHCIPHFRRRGGGAIVYIASITALPVGSGYAGNVTYLLPYAVAKAGILRLSNLMANALAEIGVRVNCICPGTTMTEAGRPFYGEEGSELRELNVSGNLIERLGQPSDIASAAVFLASDEASFVTGQALQVDGGFVASGGMGQPTAEGKRLFGPLLDEYMTFDAQWADGSEA
jgi:meso-butanediol dehydrogenase/(S,S)-butanediol dehydrogenase/diacetyl reductase